MSQVNPSNIAASVTQGALQQSQAARSGDAQRSQAARQAQKASEKSKKKVETVEDSFQTSDEHLTVDEDSAGGQHRQRDSKDEPDNADSDDPPRHIDVTA